MATEIEFTNGRDWGGLPAGSAESDLTSAGTFANLVTGAGAKLGQISIRAKATSPASWSSGKYYLAYEMKFYTPNLGDGGALGATLLGSVVIPVTYWDSTETSTTKDNNIIFPLNIVDQAVTAEGRLIGGASGYTFTGINGHVRLWARV